MAIGSRVANGYMEGKIDIDDRITHTLRRDQIDAGFDLMKTGQSIDLPGCLSPIEQ